VALRPFHFELAVACLEEIQQGRRPADAILQERFRERPQMGSKDRATVGDLVYGVLRDYRRLEALVGSEPAVMVKARAEGLEGRDESQLTEAQRLNLPDWLHDSLVAQHGLEETRAIAAGLNQPASVDLRVNTLRATREQVQQQLASQNIVAEPTPRSPWGLRMAKRGPLQSTRAFKEGWIEPQDEGSQLLALFVQAKPGDTVVDFCAGAGGKTLALGAAMQNQGRLFAHDSNPARLAKLEPRAKRAGLSIVKRFSAVRLASECDAVLIDAPCSSSGALRRNPELRLRSVSLPALQKQQLKILAEAAPLVRPGGALIYGTCSLLREENEDVADAFVARHDGFVHEEVLRLLPHRDGTDGFFAVRFRRRS
jgi:16S rRNA (cytosine967-C5)-methyltransferase